jgi:dCTP deaminase
MQFPWDDWIPGVLCRSQVVELCKQGFINGVDTSGSAIDHSSVDLSLSANAFKMREGSVKPSYTDYELILKDRKLSEKIEPANGVFTLLPKFTYVFQLHERLTRLVDSRIDSKIYGRATAKSSVGRVDVLARLIVDGMDTYEGFDPDRIKGATGNMYLEITPITFGVKVKEGRCLTQLRLFYGRPDDVEIKSNELYRTVLNGPGARDGSLSVNLENETWGGLPVAAFCARGEASASDAVPLWSEDGRSDPCRYWRFRESRGERLKIEKDQFYILRSKERIAVPRGIAIYCRASDETIGEMRIHYAGFVHPFFGRRRSDHTQGTPLIFEVRGHQVDVSLGNGERMANLQFYRMSQDCSDVDVKPSPYEDQTLKLSDFFDKWPEKLRKVGDDGTIEAAK